MSQVPMLCFAGPVHTFFRWRVPPPLHMQLPASESTSTYLRCLSGSWHSLGNHGVKCDSGMNKIAFLFYRRVP